MNKQWNWQLSCTAIAVLFCLPLVTLIILAANADSGIWAHLSQTVLADYVRNSLILSLGVALLTALIGISCAWLVTQYSFFGSRFCHWALLLPLAMPTYIIAYSYTGLLDVAGPVQKLIRSSFDLQFNQYWFPEIRSLGGAIFVMSFVLYPYVYLLARAAFLEQSRHLNDVAQLLGYNRRQSFLKINLPIARPAIIAGVSLALMETLADFGAVSYFGVSTFTTGIFRTWYGLNSVSGAAQLALVLLGFVLLLLTIEKISRKKAQYHTNKNQQALKKQSLSGSKSLYAFVLCALPILIGFIIPIAQLLIWAIQTHQQLFDLAFWKLVKNSLLLAAITAVLALALALLLSYANRLNQSTVNKISKQLLTIGYAIPGIVIAVGILIPLANFDNLLDGWFRQQFNFSTGLIISGSVAALILAYLIRFLTIALGSVDSGLAGISKNMDYAAHSLGAPAFDTLKKIHIPLMHSSLLTALLIVFVDVMKELPATLVLRPFNFNTLAVRAYELASDERLADAALASISIVLVGLIPVILLSKAINANKFEQR